MAKPEITYQIDGSYTQDQWFIRHGEYIYFYHLLMPLSAGDQGRWGKEVVGVSRSRDLLHWEYLGWALKPSEDPQAWDSRNIATGSTLEWNGNFWMFYCGSGLNDGSGGIGLATSADLIHWERVSEHRIIDFGRQYYDPSGPFADPYVFRHEKENCFYMVAVAALANTPKAQAGCVAVARSYDLLQWEVLPPLSAPGFGERMEVPQVWEHNGRWYLLFCMHPCIQSESFKHKFAPVLESAAFVLTAESFCGPYEMKGRWWILPDAGCYTGRVIFDTQGIPGFDGTPALMTWLGEFEKGKGCVRSGATDPWPVSYLPEGGLLLGRQVGNRF